VGQGRFNQPTLGPIADNMKLEAVLAFLHRGHSFEQQSDVFDRHETAEPSHPDGAGRGWQR
jgi:hypothetical protein